VFIHSHGLLYGSIILLSVGYKMAIEQIDSFVASWFVVTGATGVLVALALIRLMLNKKLFSVVLWTGLFLMLTATIFLVAVIYGTVHWLVTLTTLLFLGVAIFDYLLNQTGPANEKK
jgi:uncharacterized membrane protein (DUF2068 family)